MKIAVIESTSNETVPTTKKWVCRVCGWIYDENVGDPDGGIAAGTPFEEIPDDWVCPDCLVSKSDFVLLSV